jgi:hypothetical protein
MGRARITLLIAATVALGGCSFIDDWGGLTTSGTGVDAGDVDAGDVDAGDVDAGVPPGLPAECVAACDAIFTLDLVCVDIVSSDFGVSGCNNSPDDCVTCASSFGDEPTAAGFCSRLTTECAPPSLEGNPCVDDSECDGLGCRFGVCVRPCGDASECAISVLGGLCADIGGERFCFRAICDPVTNAECPVDSTCVVLGYDGDEAASACAPLDPSMAAIPGNLCTFLNECTRGHFCAGIGDGTNHCFEYCYDDSGCELGQVCGTIPTPMGGETLISGTRVGACYAGNAFFGDACMSSSDCFGGLPCAGGQCRVRCESHADCIPPTGGVCSDLDSDTLLECR